MIRSKGLLKNPRIHALLILAVCLVCYANTFTVPFHFDDQSYIIENPALHEPVYFMDIGRAKGFMLYHYLVNRYVGMLSLSLNYWIGGTNVAGYHIFNLAVHIGNALLVYMLFLLTMRTPAMRAAQGGGDEDTSHAAGSLGALFAALVFAAHPLQTQAVTYISQRFTSLATLFYLGSVAGYAAMRLSTGGRRKWALYALSLASALLAMKTKEIALTLPIAVLIYEWMFFEGKPGQRIAGLLPLLATIMIVPLTVLYINRPAGEIFGEISATSRADTAVSRIDYLMTQFTVIVKYLRLFVFPVAQNLDYDYPLHTSLLDPRVIGSGVLLSAFAWFGVYLFRKRPDQRIAAFGIIWFFLALSVESSVIPIRDLIFEHRMYLPMAGLVVFLGSMMAGWRAALRAKVVIVALVVIALSGATIARNTVWRSDVALWEDTISKSPKKLRVINNLAHAYVNAGMNKEALDLSMRSLSVGETKEALLNVSGSFLVAKMYDEAKKYTEKAISLDPNFAYSYQMLGAILLNTGDYRGAREALLKATSMGPYLADSFAMLSSAYGEEGHLDAALEAAQQAVKLDPGNVLGLSNMGLAWASIGKYDQALKPLSDAIRIDPKYDAAHYNLMLTYLNLCRLADAEREFKALETLTPSRASELRPQFEKAAQKCR